MGAKKKVFGVFDSILNAGLITSYFYEIWFHTIEHFENDGEVFVVILVLNLITVITES